MYKLKKNLVLTGMMGTGKSTIGDNLSKKLKIEFIDIDHIIEEKLSLSIFQIFKNKGEKFFRRIEEQESMKYLKKNGAIIALGGGAFINKKIRKYVKENSFSVWLDLDNSKLFKKLKNNKKRPLLENISEKDFKKLHDERKKVYSLADFKINCDSKSKDQIVKEIEKIYENI